MAIDSKLVTQKTVDFESVKANHPSYQLPEINWEDLDADIRSILGNEINEYGIYIKPINGKEDALLTINESKVVHPASVYKVPLAIYTLSRVDNGEISLDTKFLVTSAEKTYSFDALSKRKGNYEITVKELLRYLIIYSDNTAMSTLEHRQGGIEFIQKKLSEDFQIQSITRLPGKSTAQEFAEVFEKLIKEEYLSHESNEYLLDLLKNVAEIHNDRIKAGVPKGIEVAHKIGNLETTYHDAGIVYGSVRTYVIVVLNDGVDPAVAAAKIRKISKTTYEHLNPTE